jgi:drug/metabolite transporter (DMT)-like permease
MHPGVVAALAAAILFGASTPFAKLLLGEVAPWLLAGLLYLGSGLGLLVLRQILRSKTPLLAKGERAWLAGAILSGGVVAPVLLLYGLVRMPASGASMLLNAEGLFTALIAWFAFRENFDRRIFAGMMAILAGAVVLSWPQHLEFGAVWPAFAILGACLAWGVDNNLTRRVSLSDSTFIAMTKGLAAGAVNLLIALALGANFPPAMPGVAALLLGFIGYGLSLALFVVGLRHLGTARTGAYFSTAPFAGAAIAILLLREPVSWPFAAAAALMAVGVWLHVTERHSHFHRHDAMEHTHEHDHDAHHLHEHVSDEVVAPGQKHVHSHMHEPMSHAHIHYPDAHHRHRH